MLVSADKWTPLTRKNIRNFQLPWNGNIHKTVYTVCVFFVDSPYFPYTVDPLNIWKLGIVHHLFIAASHSSLSPIIVTPGSALQYFDERPRGTNSSTNLVANFWLEDQIQQRGIELLYSALKMNLHWKNKHDMVKPWNQCYIEMSTAWHLFKDETFQQLPLLLITHPFQSLGGPPPLPQHK